MTDYAQKHCAHSFITGFTISDLSYSQLWPHGPLQLLQGPRNSPENTLVEATVHYKTGSKI